MTCGFTCSLSLSLCDTEVQMNIVSDQSARLKKETDTIDTRKDSFSSDTDPGLVVIYYNEQQIHAFLGLPSGNTITPQVRARLYSSGEFC